MQMSTCGVCCVIQDPPALTVGEQVYPDCRGSKLKRTWCRQSPAEGVEEKEHSPLISQESMYSESAAGDAWKL